jgi:hypothetical protein
MMWNYWKKILTVIVNNSTNINGCIQRSSFEFLFLLILSCLSELLFYAYPSLFVVCLNCYSVLALDFVLFNRIREKDKSGISTANQFVRQDNVSDKHKITIRTDNRSHRYARNNNSDRRFSYLLFIPCSSLTLSVYIRIVIPCLSLILICLSECYSVLLTTFVFSVLIIVHAYPWLSLVDPNCYSMLIPEFFL